MQSPAGVPQVNDLQTWSTKIETATLPSYIDIAFARSAERNFAGDAIISRIDDKYCRIDFFRDSEGNDLSLPDPRIFAALGLDPNEEHCRAISRPVG